MSKTIVRPKERAKRLGVGLSKTYDLAARGYLAPFFSLLGSRASGAFAEDDDEVIAATQAAELAGATKSEQREIARAIVRRQVAGRAASASKSEIA